MPRLRKNFCTREYEMKPVIVDLDHLFQVFLDGASVIAIIVGGYVLVSLI